MLKINFISALLAALIPLAVGMIWYGPLFGKAWISSSGVNPEKPNGATMAKTFILTYVLSFMLALILQSLTIHQFGVQSLLMVDKDLFTPGSEANNLFNEIMTKYGTAFRTFKHGALHGAIAGIFIGVPIMAINAMFEKKNFKYIAINCGYWIVALALMGGVVCAMI